MRDIVLIVIDLAVTAAKLLGPGGRTSNCRRERPAQAATDRVASASTACAESDGDRPFPVRLWSAISKPGTYPQDRHWITAVDIAQVP
jgi:hypothetical protein